MEQAQSLVARLLAGLQEFRTSNRQTFNLIVAAIGLGAALCLGFYLFNPGAPVVLVSNLSAADHTALALRLRRHGIRFTLGSDSISVPAGQLREAERVLQGSPGFAGGVEDFSLFDRSTMGQSDFDEQVNYQRSLQGELERTIMNIRGIENARVMLAMGRPSPFALGPSEATRASVMLGTAPGAVVDPVTARAIAHLVAGSVPGLSVESVTVTANDGSTLFPSQHEGELGEAIQLRDDFEHSLEEKASALLGRIMGRNRFAVEVSVDVDTSRVTSKEQTFGNGDQTILSEEHSVTPATMAQVAAGIPGLTSNLPAPSAAASPQAQPSPAITTPSKSEGLSSGPGASRKDIVNYKPSSRELNTVTAPVRIKRISIAAVLDGTYEGGPFKPLPKERLEAIKGLLAAAIGAQPERGDSVQVQSAALSQPYIPPVPNPVTQIRSLLSDPIYLYSAIGVGLILLVLALFLATRAVKRRVAARRPAKTEAAAAPAPTPEERAVPAREPGPERDGAADRQRPSATPSTYEQMRARINQKAERDPEAAAEVLRRWLGRTNGTAPHSDGAEANTP